MRVRNVSKMPIDLIHEGVEHHFEADENIICEAPNSIIGAYPGIIEPVDPAKEAELKKIDDMIKNQIKVQTREMNRDNKIGVKKVSEIKEDLKNKKIDFGSLFGGKIRRFFKKKKREDK